MPDANFYGTLMIFFLHSTLVHILRGYRLLILHLRVVDYASLIHRNYRKVTLVTLQR